MTEAEKVAMVKAMSEEADDATVSAYLQLAGAKILRLAYPYDTTVTEIPTQYEMQQVEIAVYLLNRQGDEGKLSHSENGYSDTFESGDVPASMLRGIVPMCAALG